MCPLCVMKVCSHSLTCRLIFLASLNTRASCHKHKKARRKAQSLKPLSFNALVVLEIIYQVFKLRIYGDLSQNQICFFNFILLQKLIGLQKFVVIV